MVIMMANMPSLKASSRLLFICKKLVSLFRETKVITNMRVYPGYIY